MSLVLCLWLTGVAAADLGWRRAPNGWLLAGAALALAGLASGVSLHDIGLASAFGTALAAFVLALAFYAAGLMHAGDVKFVSALGLWLGASSLLAVVTVAGLLAGAHSVLWLLLRLLPQPVAGGEGRSFAQRWLAHPDLGRIPYAGYLSLAALLQVGADAFSPGAFA